MNATCRTEGHDLSADRRSCLRCGVKANGDFILLKFPVVFKAGVMVCPLDKTDDELGGYRRERQIKRPLVMDEKVCTTGLMGEFRSGTVVSLDPPTVDDGGMYWYPEFDKDDDHGWTVRSFVNKKLIDHLGPRMTKAEILKALRLSDDLGDCVPDDIEKAAEDVYRLF